jgi:hypothetical protein
VAALGGGEDAALEPGAEGDVEPGGEAVFEGGVLEGVAAALLLVERGGREGVEGWEEGEEPEDEDREHGCGLGGGFGGVDGGCVFVLDRSWALDCGVEVKRKAGGGETFYNPLA